MPGFLTRLLAQRDRPFEVAPHNQGRLRLSQRLPELSLHVDLSPYDFSLLLSCHCGQWVGLFSGRVRALPNPIRLRNSFRLLLW
jgi:hypothetical protein